jgi:peptide/nickel transport system substrate-binding protein
VVESARELCGGQEVGPGDRNLHTRVSRRGLILAGAGAAAALVLVLRFGGSDAPTPPAARRGGQIVASLRSEPRSFNRLVARDYATEVVTFLTQGRLARINRATFELEPWLAERWESSADGRTHTLHVRPGVTWSDGTPFTSADVLFSFQAVFDAKAQSVVASSLLVGGQPIRAAAPDAETVILTYAAPSGPGLRLLDNLPILPKHKLEAALASGSFPSAWNNTTPPAEMVGTGPFVLREYQPGQRLVFDRNPRYWRRGPNGDALPYLDRLVLEIVPEQNAELLRLQAGDLDLTSSELRPEDYVAVRDAEDQGRLRLIELGVGPDADAFWFCLKPEVKGKDPRFKYVQAPAFRKALSYAVDRDAFAETVFLGAAVPLWGPITPGNIHWFWPDVPRYEHGDKEALSWLASVGVAPRVADGVAVDEGGRGSVEMRFTVLTQRGISWYERGTAVLRDELAKIGIVLDIVPLEVGALIQRLLACDYDAVYYRPVMTDLDPAGNLDFWLSSGSAHLWNIGQKTPATEWERRIDTLMLEQAASIDPERRRQQFNLVQQIVAENLPALYFAAPRLYYAHSTRLRGVVPSVQRPAVLWSADTLSVTP